VWVFPHRHSYRCDPKFPNPILQPPRFFSHFSRLLSVHRTAACGVRRVGRAALAKQRRAGGLANARASEQRRAGRTSSAGRASEPRRAAEQRRAGDRAKERARLQLALGARLCSENGAAGARRSARVASGTASAGPGHSTGAHRRLAAQAHLSSAPREVNISNSPSPLSDMVTGDAPMECFIDLMLLSN
jgi:hypothetical protein